MTFDEYEAGNRRQFYIKLALAPFVVPLLPLVIVFMAGYALLDLLQHAYTRFKDGSSMRL